jgi:hypothetical protein
VAPLSKMPRRDIISVAFGSLDCLVITYLAMWKKQASACGMGLLPVSSARGLRAEERGRDLLAERRCCHSQWQEAAFSDG